MVYRKTNQFMRWARYESIYEMPEPNRNFCQSKTYIFPTRYLCISRCILMNIRVCVWFVCLISLFITRALIRQRENVTPNSNVSSARINHYKYWFNAITRYAEHNNQYTCNIIYQRHLDTWYTQRKYSICDTRSWTFLLINGELFRMWQPKLHGVSILTINTGMVGLTRLTSTDKKMQ